MLELDDDVVWMVSMDEAESVRSALRFSLLGDALKSWWWKSGKSVVLLGGLLDQSALPLGVASPDVEADALALKGAVERVCGGRHLEECVWCVWCVVRF
jgi:hypothetical protein